MSEFHPGEHVTIPPSLLTPVRTPISTVKKWVKVSVPKRIGLSVKDMSTFAPGQPGGGGIGFSVDLATQTHVYVDSTVRDCREVVIACKRGSVVSHHVSVFKELLRTAGLSDSFFLAVVGEVDEEIVHCGLGSTSALVLGVYFGVNAALGGQFTREELRLLLAYNYVEEAPQAGLVCFGYETSMTATGAVAGGMFIISESLEVISRNSTVFRDKPVYVLLPDSATAAISVQEEATLLTECGVVDRSLSKDEIFRSLTEELNKGGDCDLRCVGQSVWQLQTMGSKRMELQKHPRGQCVLSFMESVRPLDSVLVTGMSSIGPATVVICTQDDPRIQAHAARCGLKIIAVTRVSQSGADISEAVSPLFIPVLGPPCAGKTTWCQAKATPGIAHFQAGEFLREYVRTHEDSTAVTLRRIMEAGEVRDENDVTTRVVLPELYRLATRASVVLLDGIPRSVDQMCAMRGKFATPLKKVVVLRTSVDTRRDRYDRRRRDKDADFQVRNEYDETEELLTYCSNSGVEMEIIESQQS